MKKPEKMSGQALNARLERIPSWRLLDGKLHRELEFDNFVDAFGFMTRVALVSEAMAHHPEWSNVWNRVTIDLFTHDVDAISELDFQLAEQIETFVVHGGQGQNRTDSQPEAAGC